MTPFHVPVGFSGIIEQILNCRPSGSFVSVSLLLSSHPMSMRSHMTREVCLRCRASPKSTLWALPRPAPPFLSVWVSLHECDPQVDPTPQINSTRKFQINQNPRVFFYYGGGLYLQSSQHPPCHRQAPTGSGTRLMVEQFRNGSANCCLPRVVRVPASAWANELHHRVHCSRTQMHTPVWVHRYTAPNRADRICF